MNRLDQAIKLAVEIHSGQVDKGGSPYILHPLRVMCAVEKDLRSGSGEHREDYLCVAVLHDCVEDCDNKILMLNTIAEKFGEKVEKEVDCISRGENETWNNYIRRVLHGPIARFIKIKDLEDNCDLTRLKEVTTDDINRNQMYLRAMIYLETGKGKL